MSIFDVKGPRNLNINEMDALLMERCRPWIDAKNDVESKAALDEFVGAVIEVVHIDGTNPSHRHDVTEQAKAIVRVLINDRGRKNSFRQNHEIRTYMLEKFQDRLVEALLDQKYGNTLLPDNPEVSKLKEGIRRGFKNTITVFDSQAKVFDSENLGSEEANKTESNFRIVLFEQPSQKIFDQYADWLEAHGGVRGEFVKIKRRLQEGREKLGDENWRDLIRQAAEIRPLVNSAWGLDVIADEADGENINQTHSIGYNDNGLPWYIRFAEAKDLGSQIELMMEVSHQFPTIFSADFNWPRSYAYPNNRRVETTQYPRLRPVLDAIGSIRIQWLSGCENFVRTDEDMRHPYISRMVNTSKRPSAMSVEEWKKANGAIFKENQEI